MLFKTMQMYRQQRKIDLIDCKSIMENHPEEDIVEEEEEEIVFSPFGSCYQYRFFLYAASN